MITLHESNITSFPHDNGIGVLKDAIRAYAEEELNGLFEFYMEYDSEGHLVDELKEERIIKAKAQDKLGYQLFRIYSITKNHENDNLIVRAQHITYDLADNFVESLVAINLTKKQVMELIGSSTVLPHPFTITSTNNSTRSYTRLYRTNPLQMIGGIEGSVLQMWGGQIERDNFNLILHDRRGSDDGVKVTYEKNITGLEATFDINGLVTRIFPFVFIEGSDNEPDRLITVNGKYIDSPHINDYEKIYIKPIDYSSDERINTDVTDDQIRQQLTILASQYFTETGNDKIKVDMEVQFEHLWETEEYKDLAVLELVGMGDTVTIEHSRLKVDATAIVNYIRYDCIAEKNEEVRLGSVKARLTDSVNKVVDVAEKAEQAQQTANQAIRAANGKNTIYYGPDEPTNGIEGDLWFRVIDGEYTRTYRHDGIQWQLVLSVDVRDAVNEAQQAKDSAQNAVDRANQATQQATDAINQAQTAFDEAQQALGTANNAMTQATNAFSKAQEGFDKAQQALGTANNAMTQATSAFSLANDAFNEVESLSTMVDENTGEISTIKQSVIGLQTQVSDNAGNISSLTQIATGLQTQVTDIEGNVSTLQQTAQGLQSSVTNLQDEWDNLEIGGRNYIRNLYSGEWFKLNSSLNVDVISETRARVYRDSGTADHRYAITVPLEPSTEYTIAANFIEADNSYFLFREKNNTTKDRSGQINIHAPDQRTTGNYTVGEGEVVYTFTTTENTRSILIEIGSSGNGAFDVTFEDMRLQKGNKATDWTPAPEDIDHQFSIITQTIDSITTRVGDAEGNITALQQTSSSLAARLTNAEGNITTLTATVNGLQTTVSNVQGDVSSVTQLANALQVRMTNAEGNISTLTQTAQGLQSSVTNLQDEWDNLEIGGRNLVLSSEPTYRIESSYLGWDIVMNELHSQLGKPVTFSFEARTLDNPTDVVAVYFRGNGTYYFKTQAITNEWSRYAITFDVVSNMLEKPQIAFHTRAGGASDFTGEFRKLKLEKGNKATDWTPAPEDIDHQFSIITQTIDSITTRVGDAEGNITALQQTSSSLAGRLTDAEGNITTLTATVNGLQTTVSNVQGDVSSVTQLANALQVRMTNAEGNISTLTQTASSLQSTVSSLQNDFDNLEIGGRNLLRDSNSFTRYTGSEGSMVNKEHNVTVEEWGTSEATRITASGGTSTNKVIVRLEGHIRGEHVTYSVWVKNVGDVPIQYNLNGIYGTSPVINQGEQKRIVISGTTRTTYEWVQLRIRSFPNDVDASLDFIVWREKFERGNRATDWTPAPEDMATQSQITQLSDAINLRVMKGDVINQINISDESILIDGKRIHITGQTTIDNGVIKSAHIESLDAGKITTGTLDAALVSVINLSANSITSGTINANNVAVSVKNGVQEVRLGETGLESIDSNGNVRIHLGVRNIAGKGQSDPATLRFFKDGSAASASIGLNTGGAFVIGSTNPDITMELYSDSNIIMYYNTLRLTSKYGLTDYNNRYFIVSNAVSAEGDSNPALLPNVSGWGYIGTSTNRLWHIYSNHVNYVNLNQLSSREFKTDIQNVEVEYLQSVFDEINLVKFKYDFKDEQRTPDDKIHFGIIAEDSPYEILDETGKQLHINNYINVIAGSLKYQTRRINKHQDEIERLKLENQYLKQKIKQLEEMIA